jgi:hypothetical protein
MASCSQMSSWGVYGMTTGQSKVSGVVHNFLYGVVKLISPSDWLWTRTFILPAGRPQDVGGEGYLLVLVLLLLDAVERSSNGTWFETYCLVIVAPANTG